MHANKTKFERNSPLAVRVLIFSLQKKKQNKTKQKRRNMQAKVVYCVLGWLFDTNL